MMYIANAESISVLCSIRSAALYAFQCCQWCSIRCIKQLLISKDSHACTDDLYSAEEEEEGDGYDEDEEDEGDLEEAGRRAAGRRRVQSESSRRKVTRQKGKKKQGAKATQQGEEEEHEQEQEAAGEPKAVEAEPESVEHISDTGLAKGDTNDAVHFHMCATLTNRLSINQ